MFCQIWISKVPVKKANTQVQIQWICRYYLDLFCMYLFNTFKIPNEEFPSSVGILTHFIRKILVLVKVHYLYRILISAEYFLNPTNNSKWFWLLVSWGEKNRSQSTKSASNIKSKWNWIQINKIKDIISIQIYKLK